MDHLDRRFVRIRGTRESGWVSFDFAMGDPSLSVELILPYPAFVEFCEQHGVVFMTPEQGAEVDLERLAWRHGDAGGRKGRPWLRHGAPTTGSEGP